MQEGPNTYIYNSCQGCKYLCYVTDTYTDTCLDENDEYEEEEDTTYMVCTHPRGYENRPLGWHTPEWCPFLEQKEIIIDKV